MITTTNSKCGLHDYCKLHVYILFYNLLFIIGSCAHLSGSSHSQSQLKKVKVKQSTLNAKPKRLLTINTTIENEEHINFKLAFKRKWKEDGDPLFQFFKFENATANDITQEDEGNITNINDVDNEEYEDNVDFENPNAPKPDHSKLPDIDNQSKFVVVCKTKHCNYKAKVSNNNIYNTILL